MKRAVSYSLIGLAMALSGSVSYADDTASSATATSHHHGPHQPPKEAFTACANHNENDACSVTTPHGDVLDGTCVPAPAMSSADSSNSTQSSALACRPSHMPPPPQEGDAPEGQEPAGDGSEE